MGISKSARESFQIVNNRWLVMHIIIDGYNLIRQSDTLRRFERISLEAGRKALIKLVSLYKKGKSHKITIVFDGWENGSPIEERDYETGIYVIYSKLGVKADEVIKRIVQAKGEEIIVVTSDRDIANFVIHRGEAVISPGEFEIRIEKSRGKGSPLIPEADDEDDQLRRGRTKKRGPAKRSSRKEKASLAKIGKL